MRLASSYLIVFSCVSCASQAPTPQAASRAVDPYKDVVIIPQDICPKFGGWIAKTQDAQALEEKILIEQERDFRIAVMDAQGARALAEMQRDRAVEELDKTSWWSRWGLPIGAAVGATLTGVFAMSLYIGLRR